MEYSPYIILAFFLTEYNELLSSSVLLIWGAAIFALRLGHGLQLANPTSLPKLLRPAGALSTVFTLGLLGTLNLLYGLSGKGN